MSIYDDLKSRLKEIEQQAQTLLENVQQSIEEIDDNADKIVNTSYFQGYLQKVFYAIGEMDKIDSKIRSILDSNQVEDANGYKSYVSVDETSNDQ